MYHNSNTSADKNKIDQLNQEAWKVRVSDSNRAFALTQQALELAHNSNYTRGKAEALRTMGFCYVRLSKNTEAQACFEESFKLFASLNDIGGQGYIYTGLGIIQRNVGDYKAALELFFKSLELIKETNYSEIEPLVYYHIGVTYKYMGNLEQALEYMLRSLNAGREINSWTTESYTLHILGSIYDELGDYANALDYYHQGLTIRIKAGDKWGEAGSLDNIGNIYLRQGDCHKAMEYCRQSFDITRSVGDKKGEANSLFHLAEIEYLQNNHLTALERAKQSLRIREEIGDKKGQAELYLYMAGWIRPDLPEAEQTHQRLQFLSKALTLSEATGTQDISSKIHYGFYKLFKQRNEYENALVHLEAHNVLEKEIHTKSFNQKILNLEIMHKVEQSKKEAEIYRLRNVELANLYDESNKQKEEIQAALTELKATQAQLVQREKMASLGELTAGIAHEIQNPLNFVNNFSGVNKDLIAELKQEADKGNIAEVKAIAKDIEENEQKINYHGKRVDAIVKSMLQHSRLSEGRKEPTDINTLAEEYLRLSYQGLRAKDKSFNATIVTHFDQNIGKITLVPQDIGRVLLNLFNNAFYAVHEQMNKLGIGYEPTVSVCTKRMEHKIEITVKDNGMGISKSLHDKVFQPFFTTKPTGQGTGLGLSLSYDIIKAHGGELKVVSEHGQGAEFIISLID